MDTKSEATRLLLAWSAGDETALERLLPLVEDELRRIAQGFMARVVALSEAGIPKEVIAEMAGASSAPSSTTETVVVR